MNTPEEIEVEVFRAGDYGARGVYTPQDLAGIAADYDPAAHEAPVTLDHAQSGPAHGWVRAIRCVGDRLVATLARLSPALGAAIRQHAFKKRSIELYRRLPATGRPYLKAVSFLGAAAPEVKGLADPAFAGAQEVVSFEEEVPPREDAATLARARLVSAGTWKPEWEAAGLAAIFNALGEGAEADSLVAFLETMAPPVSLGRSPVDPPSVDSRFAESLHGVASPESEQRHQAALRLIAARPGLDYRQALLEAVTGA